MSNNTVTLTNEIKRELHRLDIKVVAIIFGMIGFGGGASLIGVLALVGVSLKGLLMMLLPTFGVSMLMSGFGIGALVGGAVTIAVLNYSKKKVIPYTNMPNEIEIVKNGLIALGAFVTTIENTVNAKKIANIFYNISKRFQKVESRVTRLEENEVFLHRIIAEQKRAIFDLKYEKGQLEKKLLEKNENSIPLEEFERLSARLLKVEEELRNLKGE